nr:odorant receptor 1.2 [Papilio glaucus]
MASISRQSRNKTTKLFHTLNQFGIVAGLPNLWVTDIEMSRFFLSNVFSKLTKFMTIACWVFMFAEIGSLFTQKNISDKQRNDLLIFCTCHPLLYLCWWTVAHYKGKVKIVTECLWLSLKAKYNDLDVERKMLRKAKIFVTASVASIYMTLTAYTIDGVIQVLKGKSSSFTTIITAWPDIDDTSGLANVGRAFTYVTWWILVIRSSAATSIISFTTICLSSQYIQLQSYFYKLDEIFTDENLNQNEKEEKYEEALKDGIKMHSETLQCVQIVQDIYAPAYSSQIAINIIALIMLLLQLVDIEWSLINAVSWGSFTMALLSTTGIFMCSAGDITIEAGLLPTAMYSSGWQNCYGASNGRVRRLLLVAMTQGQQPVVLKAFKRVELSYQSFVSIVKSSYSVFSVLY